MNLEDRIIHWHRLFGLTLCDLFSYTFYPVELEKDLPLKQQFLDVVIIAQNHADSFDCSTLPDGLDNRNRSLPPSTEAEQAKPTPHVGRG